MPYILNTADDQQAMLAAIGANSIDELFAMVPAELRLQRPLDLPTALGELELTEHVASLAGRNRPASEQVCFLGAGCYDHFVPAVVDFVAARSEFYTSYTPYQAEASQGNLQVFFEYQTLLAQLTGMDVANASLYDGATAAVEAVLMAIHATRRAGRVVVAGSVHPEYRQTLATYLANMNAELVTLPTPQAALDQAALEAALDDQTACVLVQHPNFFGCLEDMPAIVAAAHAKGALVVAAVDPISLGLLKRPGEYGVDIVVAEGQPLGIPLQFGGPFLGMIACRAEFMRRMPGRLVGQTVDRQGRPCFVLTLQTREQHIRREKATSNICTNQGLLALRATVYLAALGPQGLRQTAELCLQKAGYAREQLTANGQLSAAFAQPTFKEFVLRVADGDVEGRLRRAQEAGIFAGLPLGRWYPQFADCILLAVTEKRTRAQIDRLAAIWRS